MKSEELEVKSEELASVAVNRKCLCSFPISHLPSPISHSPSGFSLVEVMLAVGIVAFAVVGVLTAFPVGIEAARDSRDENTAALVADDVFTRLRSQAFGSTFVLPESTWTKRPNGLRLPTNSPYGWTSLNNMLYYARDGRLANANSTADGKPPGANDSPKGDEGYFGVRIYFRCDPYNPIAGTRDDASVINLTGLASVLVEISWPARTPYDNRKFKRRFESAIADIH